MELVEGEFRDHVDSLLGRGNKKQDREADLRTKITEFRNNLDVKHNEKKSN